MAEYLIKWNAGYGESVEAIEADNGSDAIDWAYENWKDEAEGQAEYSADLMTDALREEHGL